ncbi:hypothetical protein C8Q76DRAFT_818987 [Earliella scabrosa]|nr:hypothetical protein C8Q76DRAFT_818987 [Earliella scabrosa]
MSSTLPKKSAQKIPREPYVPSKLSKGVVAVPRTLTAQSAGSSTGSPYLPSYSESRDAFQQTMLDILNLPPERMTPGFRDILAKGKELLGELDDLQQRANERELQRASALAQYAAGSHILPIVPDRNRGPARVLGRPPVVRKKASWAKYRLVLGNRPKGKHAPLHKAVVEKALQQEKSGKRVKGPDLGPPPYVPRGTPSTSRREDWSGLVARRCFTSLGMVKLQDVDDMDVDRPSWESNGLIHRTFGRRATRGRLVIRIGGRTYVVLQDSTWVLIPGP